MSRSSSGALILVLGVIALVGVGTLTAAACTAPSSLKLTLDGSHLQRGVVSEDEATTAWVAEEALSSDLSVPVAVASRSTFADFAVKDAVPPSIVVSSAKLSRLRRPPGAYSLRLGVVIRDDVERNPVGYTVVVQSSGRELARKVGTTASGTVSLALRIRALSGKRSIRVVVTAIDPVGNKASLARTVRLPREGHGKELRPV